MRSPAFIRTRRTRFEDAEDQVVRVRNGLHPGGPPTHEYEGEQAFLDLSASPLRLLEAVYNGAAYLQGVSQALEVEGVLLGPFCPEKGGAAAGSQHEAVVGEVPEFGSDLLSLEVYVLYLALAELHPVRAEQTAQGACSVAHLHVAAYGRGDHWPEGRVVVPVYK
jgi:hypothetical protein